MSLLFRLCISVSVSVSVVILCCLLTFSLLRVLLQQRTHVRDFRDAEAVEPHSTYKRFVRRPKALLLPLLLFYSRTLCADAADERPGQPSAPGVVVLYPLVFRHAQQEAALPRELCNGAKNTVTSAV